MNRIPDKKSALELLRKDPLELGSLANDFRISKHSNRAYYTINAAITYSNTCQAMCLICSFARREGAEGAYVLGAEEVYEGRSAFPRRGRWKCT